MIPDDELLRRFLDGHSEAAFTELVQRHLPLVRATALRRVGGDAHASDDVTQQVFVALARKAAALRGHATLAGWLYTATHHATADWVRREQRRKQREIAASTMHPSESPAETSADAERLRPLLDDALVTLRPDEREAIVLRFFSGRTFSEIGATLTLSEEAARKRVDRALEKLHATMLRRGVTSTVAALGGALSAASVQPGSAGFVTQVAGAALAKAAAPSLAAALWPAVAAATLAGGAFLIFPQQRANANAATALAARESQLTQTIAAAEAENWQLQRELTSQRITTAARQQQIPAVRATVPPPAPARPAGVEVSVSPRGEVFWNGEPVRLDEFLVLLKHQTTASDAAARLVVNARGARFRQLSWVLDEARKAGIPHMVIDSDAAPVGPQNTWF
jgi:RNA polymerase sigma factor (sigma-70 family)